MHNECFAAAEAKKEQIDSASRTAIIVAAAMAALSSGTLEADTIEVMLNLKSVLEEGGDDAA